MLVQLFQCAALELRNRVRVVSVPPFPLSVVPKLIVAMNSLFLLCYAPRAATISWAAFGQSRKRGIVLSGTKGEAGTHFKVPEKRVVKPDDLLLYSWEVVGADGYWVEFSRPLIQAHVSPRTAAMRDVYPEALEAARLRMRKGEPISNVHRAATEVFAGAVAGLGTGRATRLARP